MNLMNMIISSFHPVGVVFRPSRAQSDSAKLMQSDEKEFTLKVIFSVYGNQQTHRNSG
jgi:hypothetical protein